jgi:hypothetical protein
VQKNGPEIRLIAFAERTAQGQGGPITLLVYVVNESPATLSILNDLDSINVPERLPDGGGTAHDADLIHFDYGESGSGTFIQVAPGECVKVTLLLSEEQAALLERVKQMKAAVRYQDGADETGEVKTVLLPAAVYKTIQG